MSGKLYLCATPIGNLEDITIRVINKLKSVDLIAAEDTRQTIKLLNHYEIKTPMTSYHEHNKNIKTQYLINQLKEGKKIALVSDAGLPGISDPGEELVASCHAEAIDVTTLPGASAGITALTMSGISTRRFSFEGFLPANKKERRKILDILRDETRTIILYEAPHHLLKSLEEIFEYLGNRKIAVCKEISKKFESVELLDIENAISRYTLEKPRGEYVLIIEGKKIETLEMEKIKEWEDLDIIEHMEFYTRKNIDSKEAMKLVAKDRGISKREVYRESLSQKKEDTK